MNTTISYNVQSRAITLNRNPVEGELVTLVITLSSGTFDANGTYVTTLLYGGTRVATSTNASVNGAELTVADISFDTTQMHAAFAADDELDFIPCDLIVKDTKAANKDAVVLCKLEVYRDPDEDGTGTPSDGADHIINVSSDTVRTETSGDYILIVDTSGGDVSVTFPAAALGLAYTVVNIGANSVSFTLDGTDTCNGEASATDHDVQYGSLRFIGQSGGWIVPERLAVA